MFRTLDTTEELEYFKLLYNFEDTKRFCESKMAHCDTCKKDVNYWLKEVTKIIDTKKSHSHYKYFLDLKRRMEIFIRRKY